MLTAPREQLATRRRLPPEALLRALERIAAVVRVDAREEPLRARIEQRFREAPAEAVDVGGQGAAHVVADAPAVQDRPRGQRRQRRLVEQFEAEGFYVHPVNRQEQIYQLRKDRIIIGLHRSGEQILFDCGRRDECWGTSVSRS